jgi:hypothetical protein
MSTLQLTKEQLKALPLWLRRFDGLGPDGATPISKRSWQRARSAATHGPPSARKPKALAAGFTLALAEEAHSLLSSYANGDPPAKNMDRLLACGVQLERSITALRSNTEAATARLAKARANIVNKTGRKVNLKLTDPSGKSHLVTSYKAAAAMTGYACGSLRTMVSNGAGHCSLGRGALEERWLIEKLA